MIKNLKNIGLGLIAALCFSTTSNAQSNFGFYGGMQNMPQAHNYNPAFNADNKFHFSLGTGMHSFGFSNSGFVLSDLLVERSQDDSLLLSPVNAVSKMAKLNFMDVNVQNELFSFGMKIRKMYFSFGVVNRANFQFAYPKDLFLLVTEGNGGSLLGQRASIDGFGINANSYIETNIGVNREFGEKLKIGAKVKFLSGIANVDTKKSVLGLYTDATTFDLTLDGELDLRTSGLPIDSTYSFDPATALTARNKGLAFDFGATYQLSEKLLLSASVLDLGFINWTQNIQNYKRSNFTYTFDGVDVNQAINDSNYVQTITDTLQEIFKVEGNKDSYSSTLPARIIVGANMELTKNFGAGAYLFSDFSNSKYRPTLMVQGSFNLKEWLMINLNYSLSARSATNLGFGLGLKGAGMAFFVSTDNMFGFLTPAYSKNFHVSTGLAFCIGRDDDKKKDKKAKKKSKDAEE